MNEYMEFSAKTVDEAITKALLELGISSDRLDYKVIEKGSSGFLGMFARPAVIRVAKPTESEDEYLLEMPKKKEKKEEAPKAQKPQEKDTPKAPKNPVKENKEASAKEKQPQKAPKAQKSQEKEAPKALKNNEKDANKGPKPQKDKKPQHKEASKEAPKAEKVKEAPKAVVKEEPKEPVVLVKPTDEATLELLARVEKFLGEMFGAMKMAVTIETGYDAEEKTIIVNLSGDDMGVLIGKRGQTLDSIQYLSSLVVNKGEEEYIRVKVDTENYRERRKETLENLARNISFKVKRTKRPVSLEPMNPYERRVIHAALQNDKYVVTRSEGVEPYRHIVISPKNTRYGSRK